MDTTKTLAIIGRSGHGKVIADIALLNGYTNILWIDDDVSKGHPTLSEFIKKYADIPATIAIGNNLIRQKIFDQLKQKNISMPALIHPSAIISPSAKIAQASVVMPLVIINADSTIEEACIINSGSIIEHDNHIEAFTHISPNVALAGDVHISTHTHIGIGCSVIQGLYIGKNVIVAAGSSVIYDVPDNVMVAGSPAIIKKELK